MINKASDITVYSVSGKLYNPIHNFEMSECKVAISYSVSRVATAFFGYSDIVLGKAGGYGYDKTSTVLAKAISKLTGKDLYDSGSGEHRVIERAQKIGIEVKLIW